jgi:hypothetical protein
MKRVTVYFFKGLTDINTVQTTVSKRPATLDAIDRVGGQAIMESALEIDETELDADGFRMK